MIKKLLVIIVLVMVASLSVAGCVSSPTNSNQTAGSTTSQPASTTAGTTTSTSASASATPKAAPTAVPTATPVVPTTPTPTAIPTPTPAPVTAQVYMLDMPSTVNAGATMQIRIQVLNSVTGAGMPGVTVLIDGVMGTVNTQVTTGANGEVITSFLVPPGLAGASMQDSISLCSSPTTPNTVGSCTLSWFALVTPPVGNTTA